VRQRAGLRLLLGQRLNNLISLTRLMEFEDLVQRYDKSRMVDLILSSPLEFEEYFEKYGEVSLPPSVAGVRMPGEWKSIVVLGMGGSAIVGDILRSYLLDRVDVPVEVVRDMRIPAHVGEGALLIAVSYSGNTMETLKAAMEGVRRGAYLVAVTSGGMLGQLAAKVGAAIYELPSGRPSRTALPPMLAAILRIVEAAGLAEPVNAREAAAKAREVVEEIRGDPLGSRPARIAAELDGKVPLVYSYQPYSPLGLRLKTQINENAKYHAFYAELPEADHNEVMGWEGGLAAPYHAVFVRGSKEPEELTVIIDYWREILGERGVRASELRSSGGGRLSEYLELMVLVDFTSYVLALMRGVDPTPVVTISRMKKVLEDRLHVSVHLRREMEELLSRH